MQPRATFQDSGFRHQLTHRDVEHGTGGAEGHVAEELLPDHERHVGEGADVEAGLVPSLRNPLDAVTQAAAHFGDPYQSHAFVVHVPRLRDRRPEPLGDPDHDVLFRDALGHPLACAQPVLERHDDTVGLQQRCDLRCHRVDVRCLGGDHPDITGPRSSGCVADMEVVDDVAATGPRHGQPGSGDGVDVLLPDVDGPHLVAGLAEEAGVHRAHCSGSDYCDLHVVLCESPMAGQRSYGTGSCSRRRPTTGPRRRLRERAAPGRRPAGSQCRRGPRPRRRAGRCGR